MGYLLQNFKKAIIQNCDPNEPTPPGGQPCRAEIQWYGVRDVGLRDVCSNVRLWGMQCEIDRQAELSKLPERSNKTPADISELVLDERLDLKFSRGSSPKIAKFLNMINYPPKWLGLI